MAVVVRRAGRGDAEAIVTALLDAPQFAARLTADDRPELVARTQAAIQSGDDTRRVLLVAELEGEVVGYAHVHWIPMLFLAGVEGYVSELFVRRTARGRGCGGQLLATIEHLAKERGAARLFLLNGRESPAYRRGFYPKHGFREATHLAPFRREPAPG